MDYFAKEATSQDISTCLYLSQDLIGFGNRTISLENIYYQYRITKRNIDKVVEVLLGIDNTVYTYTWNENEKTCNRSPRPMVVANAKCGKPERQIQILGASCDVSYNGSYRFTLKAGQEECPPAPVPLSGPVQNGYYQIKDRFSQKCLDVRDNWDNEGALLEQWACTQNKSQMFNLTNLSGDLYTVTSYRSMRCLSPEGASVDDGTPIVQSDCSFMNHQLVRLLASENGSYVMRFAHSDLCLDAPGLGRDNGRELRETMCTGEADQDWTFAAADPFAMPDSEVRMDLAYEIVGGFSNKCLDVRGKSEANGAQLQQWTCAGSVNQRFTFEEVGNGFYKLKTASTGKCISAEGGKKDNGTRMIQRDCTSGENQQIRLVPVENGAYTLRFAHSGKCIDVQDTSADDGKEVHQWDCGSTPDQRWFLKEKTDQDAWTGDDMSAGNIGGNPGMSVAQCQYKHKENTQGGSKGETTFLDAKGAAKSCDANGDWKTACKDGDGKTDEIGCSLPATNAGGSAGAQCQYKHKKDTQGGKSGQVNAADAFGKSKSCDKKADWKMSCKDGNGDTDEVGCL